jgi:hypothetical protein
MNVPNAALSQAGCEGGSASRYANSSMGSEHDVGEQGLLGVHVHRGDHHHPCQNRGAAMDDPVPLVLDNRDT